MVTLLVTAAVVAVMFLVMAQESGLSTDRAGRIQPLTRFARLTGKCIGGQIDGRISGRDIFGNLIYLCRNDKRMDVVALRTVNLVYFSHEDPSPFGRYLDLW